MSTLLALPPEMPMIEDSSGTPGKKTLKAEDLLSFKAVGRPIALNAVADEFRLMQAQLKTRLTSKIAARVCEKSGSHLLKLVSARAVGDEACLYIDSPSANRRPKVLPSTNAPDIPYCKLLYRPLEIMGHSTRCIVDDVMNPDEVSKTILEAFALVFGQDVLDAMRAALLERPKTITKLAAGEFPVIFVPRPDNTDLQITPVSPASAFMGMKGVINALYERRRAESVKVPHGAFLNQSISSKPQNISGAIGGPRRRIMAFMPPVLEQFDAELRRYVLGGSFPRWRDTAVADWVLRYADMLEADARYNDRNTRTALDRTADRLIRDANDFIAETHEEAILVAEEIGADPASLAVLPKPDLVLIRRRWPEDTFPKARKALTSPHFDNRSSRLATDEKVPFA
jgi:hypothetical protein